MAVNFDFERMTSTQYDVMKIADFIDDAGNKLHADVFNLLSDSRLALNAKKLEQDPDFMLHSVEITPEERGDKKTWLLEMRFTSNGKAMNTRRNGDKVYDTFLRKRFESRAALDAFHAKMTAQEQVVGQYVRDEIARVFEPAQKDSTVAITQEMTDNGASKGVVETTPSESKAEEHAQRLDATEAADTKAKDGVAGAETNAADGVAAKPEDVLDAFIMAVYRHNFAKAYELEQEIPEKAAQFLYDYSENGNAGGVQEYIAYKEAKLEADANKDVDKTQGKNPTGRDADKAPAGHSPDGDDCELQDDSDAQAAVVDDSASESETVMTRDDSHVPPLYRPDFIGPYDDPDLGLPYFLRYRNDLLTVPPAAESVQEEGVAEVQHKPIDVSHLDKQAQTNAEDISNKFSWFIFYSEFQEASELESRYPEIVSEYIKEYAKEDYVQAYLAYKKSLEQEVEEFNETYTRPEDVKSRQQGAPAEGTSAPADADDKTEGDDTSPDAVGAPTSFVDPVEGYPTLRSLEKAFGPLLFGYFETPQEHGDIFYHEEPYTYTVDNSVPLNEVRQTYARLEDDELVFYDQNPVYMADYAKVIKRASSDGETVTVSNADGTTSTISLKQHRADMKAQGYDDPAYQASQSQYGAVPQNYMTEWSYFQVSQPATSQRPTSPTSESGVNTTETRNGVEGLTIDTIKRYTQEPPRNNSGGIGLRAR